MSRVAFCRRPTQSGLSLVELLVAITIGAILLSGAVSLFVSNKVTYQVTNDLSRLQENARFALDLMVRDLRMAGYFGCMNNLDNITDNVAAGAGSLWDVSNPIEGVDDVAGGETWQPTGVVGVVVGSDGASGEMIAGTDAFTVRYALGLNAPVTVGTATQIQVADVGPFVQNTVAVVSDCGSADLFRLTTVDTATNTLVPNGLSRAYEETANSAVMNYYAARYYVGVNASGGRSLFRETTQVVGTALAPLREELVDGVDQMQVLYGVDGDDDGAPDAFLTAGAVGLSTLAEWRRVVAVRIALLLSTIDEYGQEVDSNVYTLNDRADIGPFDDRRRRRIFTTTAMVRNLQ